MFVVLMLATAYLLGSIPTAVIAGRLLAGIDIRTRGSGNAGATNTARILGFRAGLIVAIVDLAKGLAAVLLVSRIATLPGSVGPVLCGLAAVGGHIFPVFAGFRGGKGVATSAGAAIALFPILATFCLACFLLVAALSRWVALASLTAALALPLTYLISCVFGRGFDPWRMVFAVAVFLITIFTHRGNLARLFRGEERQLDIKGMFRRRSGETHE
jgi:glycerol-3-phosphate acyltransferase PlsY